MGATEIALDSSLLFRLAQLRCPKAYHGTAAPKLFEHTCPFGFSHHLTIGGRTEQWVSGGRPRTWTLDLSRV